ncbi:MAG: hypothetical protein ACYC0B_10335 [Gemmatimonadaceae bacterium]
MTAPERETAGSVRSAHVAYFLPPDWARVARRAAPALERIMRDDSHVQLLILVPDAGAALSLARALANHKQAEGVRVVAATSPARTQRMINGAPAQVIIGAPSVLAPVLTGAALKLDQVANVLFAAADEFDADSPELATVLAEVPRTATRVLTALSATPGVEAILERYLHRARRVLDDVAPAEDAPAAVSVRYHTISGSPVDALALVLDEVDAPSATILASDAVIADSARAMLKAIGYAEDGLARVSDQDVRPNSALVVTLGIPKATAWAAAVAAQPAQIVAIITPRELSALQLLAGETAPQPFVARAAVLRARASDARVRAELREQLAQSIPSREVLALEPLLGEHDGLEIAAAALRLLERTRSAQAELVSAAELRVRTQMKELQREREERDAAGAGTGGTERPRSFPPRDDRPRSSGPRSDKPRSFGPRSDKPRSFGARDDKPRSFGARDDKPRSFGARDDKPRSFGARDDKPRGFGPRSDKPRGGPRAGGSRPPKPRGDR